MYVCVCFFGTSEVDIQYVLVIYHLRTMFAKHFEFYLKVKFYIYSSKYTYVCVCVAG